MAALTEHLPLTNCHAETLLEVNEWSTTTVTRLMRNWTVVTQAVNANDTTAKRYALLVG